MKRKTILLILAAVLFSCLILTNCGSKKLSGNKNFDVVAEANFPFPQRTASLATYANEPLLPSDMIAAENQMIKLLADTLNNNLIFDSRTPLDRDNFRVVFEHHANYPRTGDRNSSKIHEEHITVSESMGYGMLILAYMAGCEAALTEAGHTWRFNAQSLKDYYDGMLRTVLSFQSPIFVEGKETKQHSWELFGFNTGVNDTKLTVNDMVHIRQRGFRHMENNNASAKIAPFANTPGGSENGSGGLTGYNNRGTNSAADGDMDIIYSLIVADKQWGSGGRYNYKELALDMLEGFYRSVIHVEYKTVLLGDWAWKEFPLDDRDVFNATRPSDFILSHLRSYKAIDSAHNWQEVIDATLNVIIDIRDALHANGAPENGLLPDFCISTYDTNFKWEPAPSDLLEGGDDKFGWNSYRTPWRLGADYLLYGDTPMPAGSLPNPSLFFYSIIPFDNFARARIGTDRNNMSGLNSIDHPLDTALANSSSASNVGVVAPFLVTAAAAGGSPGAQDDNQAWVDAFWKWRNMGAWANDWFANYYKLICMIIASGNYWKPEAM